MINLNDTSNVWKGFLMLNCDLLPGNRDWKTMLSELRNKKKHVPESVGKIISHRDAIGELERLIVKDMKKGTFGRASHFLSDVAPRPWVTGEAAGSAKAGIEQGDVDQKWYSYDPENQKLRYLSEEDWWTCAMTVEGAW